MCPPPTLMPLPSSATSASLRRLPSAKASENSPSGIKSITVSEPIYPELVEGKKSPRMCEIRRDLVLTSWNQGPLKVES